MKSLVKSLMDTSEVSFILQSSAEFLVSQSSLYFLHRSA